MGLVGGLSPYHKELKRSHQFVRVCCWGRGSGPGLGAFD